METNSIASVHSSFARRALSSGWNNPQGDQYFQQQRDRSDKANARTARFFHHMMQRIGHKLHQFVNAFKIRSNSLSQPMIFDMCMAPGGFLATALEMNSSARAVGFSLPVEMGGHKVLIPTDERIDMKFLDITMLAADIGVTDVPVQHPEHGKFFPQQLKPYDIPGGTMVVLLHKLEAWDTLLLLHTFRKFATVRLFKPRTSHAKRSSFYMVAGNIESQQPAATHAIGNWKSIWKAATFGTDEEYWKTLSEGEPSVQEVLGEFGPELIILGKDVWATQARALAQAPFIRQRS
ncbi:hypothetical protein LY76DRAFT_663308 [Colletotrichum caudatum]|nr:hypothetical protein LY76DRAFT_663308 [Colletotrichum caudatum]